MQPMNERPSLPENVIQGSDVSPPPGVLYTADAAKDTAPIQVGWLKTTCGVRPAWVHKAPLYDR